MSNDRRLPAAGSTLGPVRSAQEATRTSRPEAEPVGQVVSVDASFVQASSAYELGSEIATGGMGRIFAARDRELDRPVAIKRLLVRSNESRRRFEREIRLSARLQHPSIVNIIESGQTPDGDPFYVMKLVSGQPLNEVIKARAELAQRLALLPAVIAAADALAYAHGQRIIHRDLKPHNLLIGDFGETVVIDWGLAKDMAAPEAELPAGPYRVDPDGQGTAVGAIMGTPAYMPPEQARGEAVDQRADVYALGAMLYHVLAGHPPFVGSSPEQILEAVLTSAPVPLERRQPGVPADLVTIVGKAMATDPAARYPDAAGLAEDLKRFQTGQLVRAHVYSAGELVRRFLRRHRAAVIVAASLLIVLATGAVVSVRNIVAAEHVAQEQRVRAEERARELMLQKARALLERDPTAALASLHPYLQANGIPRAARVLAADAWSRGVSRRVLRGHDSNATQTGFLPDGTVVSTSLDGTLRLWGRDGRVRVFGKPGQNVGWLGVASDGRTVTTADLSGTTWAWTVATGASRAFPTEADPQPMADLSPDGLWLAGYGKDHRYHLWSLAGPEDRVLDPTLAAPGLDGMHFAADGALGVGTAQGLDVITPADGHRQHISDVPALSVAFSSDASQVASFGADGLIRVYDRNGALLHTLRGHVGTFLARVVFTADDQYLVSGAQLEPFAQGELFSWDLRSGKGQPLLKSQTQVNQLRALPGGHLAVSCDSDGVVSIWDAAHGTVRRLLGHESYVYDVAVSRDGRELASAGLDATVRVWALADLAPTRFYLEGQDLVKNGVPGGREPLVTSALSADGNTLYALSGDRVVVAWSLLDGSHRVLGEAATPVDEILLSPDERTIATAGDERVIRLFDSHTGQGRLLGGLGGPVARLAWAADGTLASGEPDGVVRLWDVGTGASRVLEGPAVDVVGLTFSPDGRQLAAGDSSGKIRLWELPAGRLRATLTARPGSTVTMAFSPDGGRLAAAGKGGVVQRWALAGGDPASLTELVGHKRYVGALAWSPDGRTLASGSSDHTIRLWRDDAVQVLIGHENVVLALAWAPDGLRLLSGSADRTARLWDIPTGVGRPVPHDFPVKRVAFSADGVHARSWTRHDLQIWSDDLPYDTAGLLVWIDAHTDGAGSPR
jgi:WD40 repeat protein